MAVDPLAAARGSVQAAGCTEPRLQGVGRFSAADRKREDN